MSFGVKDLANMMGIEIHQYEIHEDGSATEIPNDGKVTIKVEED